MTLYSLIAPTKSPTLVLHASLTPVQGMPYIALAALEAQGFDVFRVKICATLYKPSAPELGTRFLQ